MDRTNYEVRVGLFSLFALILLVWGWAWLKSFSLFYQPQRFTAQFSDVAGLSKNATVNVQGVRVGTVEYIEFVNDTQHQDRNKKINVHVKITDPSIVVPQGSHISIQTLGLVGAKYIEIALPKDAAGNIIGGRPLGPSDVVVPPDVEDPVRVELVINRVASRIDDIVSSIDTQTASKALNNLSQATAKLNKNMDKLSDAAESVKVASTDIAHTANKFGTTADNATVATERASSFFKTGSVTMNNISELANEFRGTSRKVNHLLDNPNFSSDLKETLTQARQTAETVRGALGEFETTIKDKDLRHDVMGSLEHLEKAADNIHASMETVNKLAADPTLRADLKDVVHNAKEAVTQANALLNQPDFKANICATLNKIRQAATNVDVASRQVQEVLDKRAPLLHMLFGRPGKKPPAAPDNPTCPPKVKTQQICPPGTAPAPGNP